MDFLVEIGQTILIGIPIFLAFRITLIIFHKKLPWLENLHKNLKNSKKEKVITFTVIIVGGLLSYYLSELFSFTNVEIGVVLGLFLGIANIFDPKMLK